MPVLYKAKDLYLTWFNYYKTIPKIHRYSLGQKIDNFLIETISAISTASFADKDKKILNVSDAIQNIDTLKILLIILWEAKSLNDKQYIDLSVRIDEIGRMLGGWLGQLKKQNSPIKSGEK